MADTVAWGVLSTAKIGREKVIPAMQRGRLSRVTALASRDLDSARTVADGLGIAKAYGSYEELLADPAIDAIYNPLPNHLHVPWTIKALEAGKHVLCEKPLGLDAADAARIIAARDASGKLVGEAFMVRHHPQWIRAREIVRSGRIGDVRAIDTNFCYFNVDPANVRNMADIGGGGLLDIGCYAVNTARYLFESEPERVVGLIELDPTFGTDRLASGILAFSDARQLTFTCSTQLTTYQRVQVLGTRGRIEIEIPFNPLPTIGCRIMIDDGSDLTGGAIVVETFPPCDHYTLQGEAFSRAILDGTPLADPIEDAIQNMRVLDALSRSGRTSQWERP